MPWFDIEQALSRAEGRVGGAGSGPVAMRRRRRDRGSSRLPALVHEALAPLLLAQERPAIKEMLALLARACDRAGRPVPGRSTLYQLIARAPCQTFAAASLPPWVRETLYNLDDTAALSGHQLALYCFNYGGSAALCFAAGLPWLCLYQAARLGGFRPKSRALLLAVMRTRHI